MNIRNHLLELQCTQREVTDVAQALVHSIIFFRTHGKFNYKHEGSYSIGTLGFERAFCDNLDFSYVRSSSLSLVSRVNNKIQEFVDKINEFTHSGTLSLEFYTKRASRWPFNDSKIVWELWNIKLLLITPASPSAIGGTTGENNRYYHHHQHHHYHHFHQQRHSESATRLEDLLSHKIFDIIKVVNGHKCSLPQMPTQPNLDTVFDTSFSDLQPYLYNLSYKISDAAPSSHSVIGGTASKSSDGALVTDTSTQSSLKKFLLGTLEL